MVRPADGNETVYAWKAVLERQSVRHSGPVGLALTRQNVPTLEGTSAEGVRRGGYVLADSDVSSGDPDVIIMATGSEVQIAVAAREALQAEGIGTRVVSMPSLDWFAAQDPDYIESVLPAAVTARVSVEAGISQPWWRWLGGHGRAVSLEHFGASADFATLFREFGITPAATVAAAKESLAAARG
jgi:transketolase